MIRLLNIPTVILATLLVFSQISQTSVQGQGLFREPKVIPVGQQSARPSTSQTADEVASQVQDFVPQATPETRLRPIAPREGFPTNDRPSGDLSNLGSSVLVPSPNERQNSFRPSIPGDGGEMRPIIPGRTDLRSMIEGSFQDEDTESDIQGPETITQRYPNGKPQLIKQVAQDAEGNYYDHGEWKVLNLQGDTLAKGQFYEGVMDGLWMRYHPQGSGGIFAAKPFNLFKAPFYSTASFSKGELDGVWLLQDAFERKVFEIPYRKGIRHGTAKWWFPNAVVMREVNFKEGLIDGPLREWNDENKLVRYEEFIDGKRIIRQTTFYRPKQRQDENFFLDGKLELSGSDDWWKAQPASFEVTTPRIQHGPALAWYENDQPKMKGQYRDDVRVGRFTWWHPNGQKALQGAYNDDGNKTGTWTWWHANGIKSIQGDYTNDVPVGPWTWWDTNGQVKANEDMDGRGSATNETQPTQEQNEAETNSEKPADLINEQDEFEALEEIEPYGDGYIDVLPGKLVPDDDENATDESEANESSGESSESDSD